MVDWQAVLTFLVVVVVAIVALKLLKVSVKWIFKLLINSLVGGLALFLLNLIPGVDMLVNIWTAMLTGVFGLPAVIVLFIISLF